MLRQLQSRDDAVTDGVVREQQWVRIIFPGVTDAQVQFETPKGGLLSRAVTEVLDETPLRMVEQLTYPGWDQHEYLFSSRPRRNIGFGKDALSTDDTADCFETLRDAGVEHTIAMLAAELDARLTDRIGCDVVEVDLTPVGTIPTRTCRLVGTTTNEIAFDQSGTESAFATHIHSLTKQQTPHLARTRVAKTTADTYLVEQQLARFERAQQVLYGDDVAALLEPVDGDLGSVYEPDALTSNYRRLGEMDWQARTLGEGLCRSHGAMVAHNDIGPGTDVETTMRAVTVDEYARLCGRDHDFERLRAVYEQLGVTPTVQLARESLTSVLGLVPNYGGGRWLSGDPVARARPQLTLVTTVSDASGTDREALGRGLSTKFGTSISAEIEAVDVWPRPSSDLLQAAIRGLREYGDTVTIDGAPSEAAFVRTTPDGLSEPVLVGTADTLVAGDLIVAAERGGGNQGVTVVTATEADAQQIFDIYRTPFQTAGDTHLALYPCSTQFWTFGNEVALRSAGETVDWWLTPDGTLTATLDGTELTTGPMTDPPADPGTPLLRVMKEPPHYSVFHPERGLLATAPSVDRLAADLSQHPIPLPVVPSQLSYLNCVTVFVVNNGRLTRVTPDAPVATGDKTWLTAALEWFLNTFTYQAPGAQLSADTVTPQFRQYIAPQTTGRFPSTADVDWSIKTLTDYEDGDKLPQRPEGRLPVLFDRDWRYPHVPGQETLPQCLKSDSTANQLALRLAQAIYT
ncbi:hypothetical protein [Halovenus salina]|uniref:Uncharacterized protein n=1 Tax=Halovenus salina TaxID=1510225 RepID=A0ABD5W480_9EURY|nr:hypothetical protein [Halovenus salina]